MKHFSKIVSFVIDGNKNNVHAENIGYRFTGGKIEVEDHPGFYYIPEYTGFGINIDGVLLYIKLNVIKSWYKTKPNPVKNITGGYLNNNVRYGPGVLANISRHRALCLVFKDYPDNVDSLTVNHINGVPGDDWLDNLEWNTRGQNNTHAYINDLKNQHHRVLVRDVRTGTVEEFYSLAEASRQEGNENGHGVHFKLNNNEFGKVFSNGKQYKLKSDKRDWVIPDDPEDAIQMATKPVIRVRDCVTLIETKYPTTSAASSATGVNNSTIRWRLDRKITGPLFGFQFKEGDGPWADFTKAELEESLIPNQFSVDCRNHLTGEEITFDSVNLAAAHVGNSHIPAVLRKGEQPLLPNGWQIKHCDLVWEEFDNFEEELYRRTKTMVAREESTGKIIIADSAREMGRILKLDNKAIRAVAMTRGNKVYHGYRFRLGVETTSWPKTILP